MSDVADVEVSSESCNTWRNSDFARFDSSDGFHDVLVKAEWATIIVRTCKNRYETYIADLQHIELVERKMLSKLREPYGGWGAASGIRQAFWHP